MTDDELDEWLVKSNQSLIESLAQVTDIDEGLRRVRATISARLACSCGHDGLDAMFHLHPCPVARVRGLARKMGFDLVRIQHRHVDQFGEDEDLEVETEPFILAGHPYTCNGGNPDIHNHHDHQVLLVRFGTLLRCPECGRTQPLKRLP